MNYKDYDDCYTPLGGRYLINDDIKEYIGRIVGRIGQKYYEKKDVSYERNIFAYELRVDSLTKSL